MSASTGSSRITSQSYRRPYRPRPVAFGLAVGRALDRAGLRVRLDEASLLASARRTTGLDLLGDSWWRESLRRMLDSLENEAQLHALGRIIARQKLGGALVNRLRAEWLRDLHAEIDRTPVEAHFVVAGVQRTGHTVLHSKQ